MSGKSASWERKSLADFVRERATEAARQAWHGDKDTLFETRLAHAIVWVVSEDPMVKKKLRASGRDERAQFAQDVAKMRRALDESGYPPGQFVAGEASPEAVEGALHGAAQGVVNAAGQSFDDIADAMERYDRATLREIEDWFRSESCPRETIAEVEARLQVLWDVERVRVKGMALGGLVTLRDGVEVFAPVDEIIRLVLETAKPNPLAPLFEAFSTRKPASYTSRHTQAVVMPTRVYSKMPGVLAAMSGELEAVEVDGEPFVGRQPSMPNGKRIAHRPRIQGELFPGPRTLDRVPTNDLLLVGLGQWNLSTDDRLILRHDIMRLGRAAYSLTGRTAIPEDVGAAWLTGHASDAGRRRWWDTLRTMRALTVVLNPRTHRWVPMFDVDPDLDGDAWIAPPTWWVQSRAEKKAGPGAWRLSGSLWRGHGGDVGFERGRGLDSGYWGVVQRTVDGIEAALTWGPTGGKGKGARLPDALTPGQRGGPGDPFFIPWRNVLRLSGERADDDDDRSSLRQRYRRRVEALVDAGYVVRKGGDTRAGDTIEIVERLASGGKGRQAGLMVRASARFIEAYRKAQDSRSFELLPARRLFLPKP